jgi:hypothetical protein
MKKRKARREPKKGSFNAQAKTPDTTRMQLVFFESSRKGPRVLLCADLMIIEQEIGSPMTFVTVVEAPTREKKIVTVFVENAQYVRRGKVTR